jgi:hypothetical protein
MAIVTLCIAVASIKGSDPGVVFPMLAISWLASIWLMAILPSGYRTLCVIGEVLFTAILVWVGVRVWPKPVIAPTPVPLTALYIGCEWDHIPITIAPGSSINVMWLEPSILRGNPNMPFVGPFDEIRSPLGKKNLEWPTKQDGRMMTRAEVDGVLQSSKTIASPYAFRCILSNYSVTLDQITAPLIIDTSDSKRHVYSVAFSPSVVGHPFEFYMVSKCSFGVVPLMVQWGEEATVRIVGEPVRRRIPLQFERKAWPSNLVMMGASWFVWNGAKGECKWD